VINRIPSASASVGVRGESNTAGSGSSGDTTIVVPVQIGNETIATIVKKVAGNRRERYFR
jgi:hypothetical protein